MIMSKKVSAGLMAAAVLSLQGCKSTDAAPASASDASTSGNSAGTSGTSTDGGASSGSNNNGSGTAGGAPTGSGSTGTGTGGIPALVSVNLQNVLNNLSVDLKVSRNNIPVTAQVPIDVAANVCGVSVSALSASIASGQASCTAKTTSAQLNQAVQQQIASGGDVIGGDQNIGTPKS